MSEENRPYQVTIGDRAVVAEYHPARDDDQGTAWDQMVRRIEADGGEWEGSDLTVIGDEWEDLVEVYLFPRQPQAKTA